MKLEASVLNVIFKIITFIDTVKIIKVVDYYNMSPG